MSTFKRIIAGLVGMAGLLLGQGVVAQTSDDPALKAAYEAYQLEDFETAREIFSREADKGNTEATLMLGTMYYQGTGTPEDKEKGKELHQKAIKMGSVEAMVNLAGFFILEGEKEKAAALLQKAGKKENIDRLELQYLKFGPTLFMYLDEKYADEELKWYVKGAEKGDVGSMLNAGSEFRKRKNYKEAIYWLEKAVALDDGFKPKLRLAEAYSDEDAWAYRDEQAALELYRQAADQGSITGTYFLGVNAARNGRYREGLELLNQAAQKKYPDGRGITFYMAECYFGLKDYEEALYRYLEIHGDLYPDEKLKRVAAGRLAEMYQKGLGVKQDYVRGKILEAEFRGE